MGVVYILTYILSNVGMRGSVCGGGSTRGIHTHNCETAFKAHHHSATNETLMTEHRDKETR
jgi:hypothetical protein